MIKEKVICSIPLGDLSINPGDIITAPAVKSRFHEKGELVRGRVALVVRTLRNDTATIIPSIPVKTDTKTSIPVDIDPYGSIILEYSLVSRILDRTLWRIRWLRRLSTWIIDLV